MLAPAAGCGRRLAGQRLRHLGGRAQERRQADRQCRPVHRLARARARIRRRARRWAGSSPRKSMARAWPARRAAPSSTGPKPTFEPTPIWAIIAPGNEPSLKLAEKLGFERLHETDYHGDPTVVLAPPGLGLSLPAAAAAAAAAAARRTAAARPADRPGRGRGRADRAGERRADRIRRSRQCRSTGSTDPEYQAKPWRAPGAAAAAASRPV